MMAAAARCCAGLLESDPTITIVYLSRNFGKGKHWPPASMTAWEAVIVIASICRSVA